MIFDLDGTLVDSAPGIASALNLVRVKPERVSVERVRSLVSGGAARLIQDALGIEDADVPDVLVAFRHVYSQEPCRGDDLYPGVISVLDGLREAGLAIGVCTNKPQHLAEVVVKSCGLDDQVDMLIGSSAELPSKPDPSMLHWLIAELKVGGKTVLIGDSDVDAEAAANAAIPFIAAHYGYGPLSRSFPSIGGINCLNDLPTLLYDSIGWKVDHRLHR